MAESAIGELLNILPGELYDSAKIVCYNVSTVIFWKLHDYYLNLLKIEDNNGEWFYYFYYTRQLQQKWRFVII